MRYVRKIFLQIKIFYKMEKTSLSNPLHFKQPRNYLEPSMVQVLSKVRKSKSVL